MPHACPIKLPQPYAAVDVAQYLVSRFSLNKNEKRAADLARREAPIEAAADGMLVDAGKYLALGAYGPALRCLARALMRMDRDFRSSDWDGYIRREQLLRVVGAPGLGKSTFVDLVWCLLPAHLEDVRDNDKQRWRRWQDKGVDELLLRLKSWGTECGPLVFKLDMSIDSEPPSSSR